MCRRNPTGKTVRPDCRATGALKSPGSSVNPQLPSSRSDLKSGLVDDFGHFLLLARAPQPLNLECRLLLEHFLAIERFHLLVLAQLLGGQLLLACRELLL